MQQLCMLTQCLARMAEYLTSATSYIVYCAFLLVDIVTLGLLSFTLLLYLLVHAPTFYEYLIAYPVT